MMTGLLGLMGVYALLLLVFAYRRDLGAALGLRAPMMGEILRRESQL